MVNVLLASQVPGLKDGVFGQEKYKDFNVVKTAGNMEDAISAFENKKLEFSICVVTDQLPSSKGMAMGSMITTMKELRPDVRIVYIAGEYLPQNAAQAELLALLVQNGVYDIVTGLSLDLNQFLELLNNPLTFEDAKYYLQNPLVAAKSDTQIYRNLISVYSIKPGSGKSFLAYNLAVAIAAFGQVKPNGKKPRVALIEGDLSSLSAGALARISNDKYNLVHALQTAASVVDTNGKVIGTREAVDEAKKEIRRCFIQHPQIPNLYALVSSTITLEEKQAVSPYHYMFVLDCVVGAFDVMVADMNSSMEHETTGPLFARSNRIYFLLDPDVNNIKNNIRYQKDLLLLNVAPRARYLMNKYISSDQQLDFAEDLEYDMHEVKNAGINISGVIPFIDPIVMNNRVMSGTPLVLDDKPSTLAARKAILRIANENWKIDMRSVESRNKDSVSSKGSVTGSLSAQKTANAARTAFNRFISMLKGNQKGEDV